MEKHLAWNEEDNNNSESEERKDSKPERKDDPWGGNRNRNRSDDNLPDLDEFFQKGQQWLKEMVGGGKNNGFNRQGAGTQGKKPSGAMFGFGLLLIGIIIGIAGFYKVEPGEEAVEYRFGKFVGIQGPGPHWIFPGIYTKETYNTSIVHQRNFEDDLITKEVNIVSVGLAVQYKIENLEDYLFKVRSPDESLAEATRAAIRHAIAKSKLGDVISTRGNVESKSEDANSTSDNNQAYYLGEQIRSFLEENLKLYQAGISIQGVEILSVAPPQQVREAFDDAIKAHEDRIRYQNEASAYKKKVVPIAEGNAARILQEANTYVAQTVLAAEGDVARFKSVLPEYKKAPAVTRHRLYITAIERVFKNTPKIIVDSKSNNVMFLPLDKLNFNKIMEDNGSASSDSKKATESISEAAIYRDSSSKSQGATTSSAVRQPTRFTTRNLRN